MGFFTPLPFSVLGLMCQLAVAPPVGGGWNRLGMPLSPNMGI